MHSRPRKVHGVCLGLGGFTLSGGSHMRKLLLAAILVGTPSVAVAQVGYIEGSIGLALISDVETDDYLLDTTARSNITYNCG